MARPIDPGFGAHLMRAPLTDATSPNVWNTSWSALSHASAAGTKAINDYAKSLMSPKNFADEYLCDPMKHTADDSIPYLGEDPEKTMSALRARAWRDYTCAELTKMVLACDAQQALNIVGRADYQRITSHYGGTSVPGEQTGRDRLQESCHLLSWPREKGSMAHHAFENAVRAALNGWNANHAAGLLARASVATGMHPNVEEAEIAARDAAASPQATKWVSDRIDALAQERRVNQEAREKERKRWEAKNAELVARQQADARREAAERAQADLAAVVSFHTAEEGAELEGSW